MITCPKCGSPIEINIAQAVDELGEIFRCSKCSFLIRFTDR